MEAESTREQTDNPREPKQPSRQRAMLKGREAQLRSASGLFIGLNPVVASITILAVVAFVVLGSVWTDQATELFTQMRDETLVLFKSWYVLLVAAILVFVLWLGFGRYKNVRLGRQDEAPEFGLFSWFAMLFAAGMGIGLIFWSVAEPILHFQGNPFITNGGTPAAATTAMRLAFFHWGMHAWAVYAFVGLSLSYFAYRLSLPLSIRSAFWPLIGRRIYGPVGHTVDVFAVLGTVFGVATSLGLGVQQLNTGLNVVAGVPTGEVPQLVIIALVTTVALLSVILGVRRGVRVLSDLNMYLTFALLVFLLIFGPTLYLAGFFLTTLGEYLHNLPLLSFWTDVNHNDGWQERWTLFYWAWWVAWAPFVGLFIARISRGRKIREFIMGVLLVPTLLTGLWLIIFGGTALHVELFGSGGITAAVNQNVTGGLYALFAGLEVHASLQWLLSVLVTILIAVYFVTSCDSGTLAITTILSVGDSEPPVRHRVVWGIGVGAIAAVLLASGGVTALQAAVIAAGLPFSLIMAIMAYALVIALRDEEAAPRRTPDQGRAEEPWTGRSKISGVKET